MAGKRILITRASYGIGEYLADTGAHLLLIARTAEKLTDVQNRIAARGGQAEIFPCDLTNPAELQALILKLQAYPDRIDLFINNAGKSISRSIFDSLDRMHDFTRTMNLMWKAKISHYPRNVTSQM